MLGALFRDKGVSLVLVYLHARSCVRFRVDSQFLLMLLTTLTTRVLLCALCVTGAPPVVFLGSPTMCSPTGIHSPYALRPDGCLPSLFLTAPGQPVLLTNLFDPPCTSTHASIKGGMLGDFLNVQTGSILHNFSNTSSEIVKMLLRGNRLEIFQVNRTSSDVFGYKEHASGTSGYPSIRAGDPAFAHIGIGGNVSSIGDLARKPLAKSNLSIDLCSDAGSYPFVNFSDAVWGWGHFEMDHTPIPDIYFSLEMLQFPSGMLGEGMSIVWHSAPDDSGLSRFVHSIFLHMNKQPVPFSQLGGIPIIHFFYITFRSQRRHSVGPQTISSPMRCRVLTRRRRFCATLACGLCWTRARPSRPIPVPAPSGCGARALVLPRTGMAPAVPPCATS